MLHFSGYNLWTENITFQVEGTMVEKKLTSKEKEEAIPLMQQLLDNPFLLLALGVTIPAILYIIWGIIEVTQIPLAN